LLKTGPACPIGTVEGSSALICPLLTKSGMAGTLAPDGEVLGVVSTNALELGVVLGVGRKYERNHLSFAAEAILKQRPDGAINLPAGKNLALAGTAFALDEAAGDASAGVSVFAVVNGEGEEIDAFTRIRIGSGGGENNVIAHAHND
jgi:hypothetical protein